MSAAFVVLVLGVCSTTGNEITHAPADAMPLPPLVAGGNAIATSANFVGESLVACGVDYSWGRQEVVGSQPTGLVMWGVNDNSRVDLTSPVDGRIVLPGTLHPATTDRFFIEAYSLAELELSTFGVDGSPLQSTHSRGNANNTHQIAVDVSPGSTRIGAFRLSIYGAANFGFDVTQVSIRDPVGVDLSPPQIIGVRTRGSTWASDGYDLPLGTPDQTLPLPFTRINQFTLVFNERVQGITGGQLSITDESGDELDMSGPYATLDSAPDTYTLVWSFDDLDVGRYQARLTDGVHDENGNLLDGEWVDGESLISGDGEPGGDFVFSFNVLPGDVNQDGVVSIVDAIEVRNLQGVESGDPAYSILHDIDARGGVDSNDVYAALVRAYDVLPSLPAGSPSTVPEPSSLALAAVGVFCFAWRFRRR